MADWKDIKDYPGYMVSNQGEVKSLNYNGTKKEKILKPIVNRKGYLTISLYHNRKFSSKLIHRLVAEAFIGNPNNKPQVNHIDGNKKNNAVNNLEWCDNRENQIHAYKIGLNKRNRAINQYDKENRFIKEWNSIADAAKSLNIDKAHIQHVCANKRSSAGGYKWKYKEAIL